MRAISTILVIGCLGGCTSVGDPAPAADAAAAPPDAGPPPPCPSLSPQSIDSFVHAQPGVGLHDLAATADGLYAVGFVPSTQTEPSRWLVRRSIDGGATWTTSDDYIYPGGPVLDRNLSHAVAADAHGGVYVVGAGSAADGPRCMVRKTTDRGATWETVDEVAADHVDGAKCYDVWSDGDTAFTIGRLGDRWMVRRSQDLGATWDTVDLDVPDTDHAKPLDVIGDRDGSVIATGYATIGSTTHWLIRRAAVADARFETVDDVTLGGNQASVEGLGITSDGTVFAGGWGMDPAGAQHGIIRRSTDGGLTWTEAAIWRDGDRDTQINDLTEDRDGRLFATGFSYLPGYVDLQAIVIVSTDGGGSWAKLAFAVGALSGIDTDLDGRLLGTGAHTGGGGAVWRLRCADQPGRGPLSR